VATAARTWFLFSWSVDIGIFLSVLNNNPHLGYNNYLTEVGQAYQENAFLMQDTHGSAYGAYGLCR
jgi:hypothetical protein